MLQQWVKNLNLTYFPPLPAAQCCQMYVLYIHHVNCPSKTLLSSELKVFNLLEQVEEFVLAFAGHGRGVGSVQMNRVSFFFSRFRELGVGDGEMSPLSFQAKQMIILTGNILFLLSIPLKIYFYLLYILCSIIVKGNFSILRTYCVFTDSPPLCNREEFNITLFITVFKLKTKQRTYFGLKLTLNAHSLSLGLLNLLTKICELDNKLMSFGAIFSSSFTIKGFFK